VVVDGFWEILLEESQEGVGTASRLVESCGGFGRGSLGNGGFGGIVGSELGGEVGGEFGDGRRRGERELLHNANMGVLSLYNKYTQAR
jgi:hypothetical protein